MTLRNLLCLWFVVASAGLTGMPDARAQNVCANGASLVNPLLAPSAPGGGGGIGGTGIVAGRPGLGGTGIGSGGIGGTGIVGVITGFASICVNGVEVHFDQTTPISDGGEPVSARQLAVGQLVAVRAAGTGTEVSASQIALIHSAVGPLSSVDARSGEFRLLGQTGQALEPQELAQLRPGDWVRVSGQRLARGEIAASRVERIAPQPEVQLNGVVERVEGGTAVVAGVAVRVPDAAPPAPWVVGREVSIAGQWDGRSLTLQRVSSEPTRQSLGNVSRVVLEGYVHAAGAGQLNLGLGAWTLSADAQVSGGSLAALAINQHVQVSGRVGPDAQITVDRVELRDGRGDAGRDRLSGSRRESSGRAARSQERDRLPEGGETREAERAEKAESSGSSGSSGRSGDADSGSGSGGSGSGSGGGGGSGSSGGSGRDGGGGGGSGSGGSGK